MESHGEDIRESDPPSRAVIEDIIKISNSIKKKYATYKNRIRDRDSKLEQSLKPVTGPLKELVKTGERRQDAERSLLLPAFKPSPLTAPFLSGHAAVPQNDQSRTSLSPPTPLSTRSSEIYGIRIVDGNTYIGNQRVDISGRTIDLEDGSRYLKTHGLMTLLNSKNPLDHEYTNTDLERYEEILVKTSAHKVNYDPSEPIIRNRTYKYKNIIRPMFTSGEGIMKWGPRPQMMTLNNKKTEYVYWDDINELVDRLRLLYQSSSAGHTAHGNEIQSILEELRESGIIE